MASPLREFAQLLANYVYNLQAACEVEQWEEAQYEKLRSRTDTTTPAGAMRMRLALKRGYHPCNPRGGNWCDTLPKAPAWFAAQALRDVVRPLLRHEGLATAEELADRYPDYSAGTDLAALAYNLANCVTGDGGGDFRNGRPTLDLYMKLNPEIWVGPKTVRLYRPQAKEPSHG